MKRTIILNILSYKRQNVYFITLTYILTKKLIQYVLK